MKYDDLSKEFWDQLEHLKNNMRTEVLVRSELGVLNLSSIHDDVMRSGNLLRLLDEALVQALPVQLARSLTDAVRKVWARWRQIEDFTGHQGGAHRDQIATAFAQDAFEFVQNFAFWIIYASSSETVWLSSQARIDTALKDISDRIESWNETEKSAKQLIDALKAAGAEAGVHRHAKEFSSAADQYAAAASRWLIATAVCGVVALVALLSFSMLAFFVPATDPYQAANVAISKIVVFGALVSAAVWMGRVYKANRHLENTNKFKATALETFRTFASAAVDQQTKDAILMETTRCIFMVPVTGLIQGDEAGADSIVRVVETAKAISTAAKP